MSGEEWSYLDAMDEYRKVGDTFHHYDLMFDEMLDEKLDFVTSCLVVGPGPCIPEFNFFKKLVPNLKKVKFVEPDPASIHCLKQNLPDSHINSLELEIEQIAIEEWKNEGGEKFDLVLMFHSIYKVPQRPAFVLKCLQKWMNLESVLYIMMKNDKKDGTFYIFSN